MQHGAPADIANAIPENWVTSWLKLKEQLKIYRVVHNQVAFLEWLVCFRIPWQLRKRESGPYLLLKVLKVFDKFHEGFDSVDLLHRRYGWRVWLVLIH